MRGRLHWLYCRYLGGWSLETTLDPFCIFQCLVGGSAGLRFSRARPSVFKSLNVFFFGSWSPGGVAHVDIVFRVRSICPAIYHNRLGTPGQAGAFRPTARATHVVVIMARGRGSRSLSICIASSGPPGCGDITRVRLHCTVEVSKPFVVQLKIRNHRASRRRYYEALKNAERVQNKERRNKSEDRRSEKQADPLLTSGSGGSSLALVLLAFRLQPTWPGFWCLLVPAADCSALLGSGAVGRCSLGLLWSGCGGHLL